MVHSEWRPLLFTCLLWYRPAIYFWGEGGGGRAKTEKEIMRKKKGEKFTSTQRSMVKKFMQVPPIFGICITGMLETEVLYF